MGYTTEFKGSFTIKPSLKEKQVKFINDFCNSRRMKRDIEGFGIEGEYYVGSGLKGQDEENNIIDYNTPPITQPGLWCKWEVNKKGDKLFWDGGEKFYDYYDWLSYLINNFFGESYLLNGEIKFQGERFYDSGIIKINNNIIKVIEEEGKNVITFIPLYKKNEFMF